MGSARSQGQGGLAAGNGNLVTDLGQDGWMNPLVGRKVPEGLTGDGESPSLSRPECQAGYHGDLISQVKIKQKPVLELN